MKLDCPASLLKGSIAPHPWWQAYHSLSERITVTGCMAHARRRFDEALTVLKKDFTKEQLKETTVYQAMARIGMLYKIGETGCLQRASGRAGQCDCIQYCGDSHAERTIHAGRQTDKSCLLN